MKRFQQLLIAGFFGPTLLFTLLFSSAYSAANDDFPGIEKLMPAAEFEAAGLNKLSADELNALNRWLVSYTATEAQVVKRHSKEVKKTAQHAQIDTSIAGRFMGWDGKTVFKLANGQVWQQRLQGYYRADLNNPKVRITRNMIGFYRLTVLESGRSVGVKRIK